MDGATASSVAGQEMLDRLGLVERLAAVPDLGAERGGVSGGGSDSDRQRLQR